MSDFDTVLERLLGDPAFAAALAANPDEVLAAYHLDPDEIEVLRSQVSTGDGGAAAGVESRTTKSSTFGLFSGVSEMIAMSQHDQGGSTATTGMGSAPRTRMGDAAHVNPLRHAAPQEVKGDVGDYRNKVDVNADGRWDQATYRPREDGGVDILVDRDHDGRVDFIGRDYDRDWTVDDALIDRDTDGVFEKTMHDDTGDGILDRTVWHRNGPDPTMK